MGAIASRLGQQATLRQAIGLTPALQQSIKLLELSNLALAELVAEALAENPLLELADAPAPGKPQPLRRPPRRASLPPPLPPGLARLFARTSRRRSPAGGADNAAGDVAAGGPSLREHLLQQLGADIADPIDWAIGRALIEAVDDAGYLTGDADGLARRLGHDPARVSALLARLQEFDPPGVFARSLGECLALQLADRGRLDDAMRHLIDHLDLLAKGDRAALMQLCGVDATRLTAMIAELRRLDPRPGLAFDRGTVVTVIPDLTIERDPGGGWQIELNDQTMPRLTINESYPLPPTADAAARRYLKERRTTAHWLLRALDRRAETLLRVAGEIVARQGAFLDGGAAALKPLSRREVALALDLHESTVGRATVNKYAATPRGVLALVDFFGGRLSSTSDPAGHAPPAVRARLKGLIEAESADRPISDERLAALLRKDGIAIARRTVAKYREILRIPPSFQRRHRAASGGLDPD
jgi:RNA polymerase sigma-54 factor